MYSKGQTIGQADYELSQLSALVAAFFSAHNIAAVRAVSLVFLGSESDAIGGGGIYPQQNTS